MNLISDRANFAVRVTTNLTYHMPLIPIEIKQMEIIYTTIILAADLFSSNTKYAYHYILY